MGRLIKWIAAAVFAPCSAYADGFAIDALTDIEFNAWQTVQMSVPRDYSDEYVTLMCARCDSVLDIAIALGPDARGSEDFVRANIISRESLLDSCIEPTVCADAGTTIEDTHVTFFRAITYNENSHVVTFNVISGGDALQIIIRASKVEDAIAYANVYWDFLKPYVIMQ